MYKVLVCSLLIVWTHMKEFRVFEMYLLGITFLCLSFTCATSLLNLGFLETAKNPFQYLEEKKYPYENHTIVTEDGYRLLLVRIKNNQNESSTNKTKPPILFVHGFACSFYDYLVAGPGISFGFKALEEGYDVFLINTRGSRWSRSHTTLDPDKDAKQFFNFSFHELGLYDLTATIDYITNLTESSAVSYVAHSQGTAAFLAMTSTRPEYNEKIRLAVLLAPVSFLDHSTFLPQAIFMHFPFLVEAVFNTLHIYEALQYSTLLSNTARVICSPHSILLPACKILFYDLVGPSTQINDTMVSAYLTNFPAGSAIKQFLHFLKNGKSKRFQFYDYGSQGNLAQYGRSVPPSYNLSAITCPVALYYGADDAITNVKDAARLASSLPNLIQDVLVPYNKTNHFDVLIGIYAEELVNRPALNLLNQYNDL